ncbi:MAG: autotransporter-associated beta strand repeat-containing protein, partial [Akkermansia sp.]|nr:autotransporter-associated beta strand repeat-containing protein [Akkermansia sp.]
MFSGNYCSANNSTENKAYGGAIYTSGALSLTGNDSVEFRGNYEQVGSGSSATYRLRSVYMEGNSTLKLAAGEGQSITFYDTLYSDARTLTISFNADYEDKDGVTQKGAGDILFSGKYAKVDLKALKSSYTQQELTDSLTTEVYSLTHLYGGRLRIEDGAIYKGYGITAEVDSAATVRLQGGTLDHAGYALTFNAGTTLEAQGVNSISASSLDLLDGSALTFTLGETNLTTAAVTLTGTFKQGGALTINLADDGTMAIGSKYALLTMSSGTTPTTWDASKVTVEGLDADISDLSWSNGTLYLTAPLPELTTATWTGAASMVWNTTAMNWTQDGITYAYKDGVDVIFGNTRAGTVTLSSTLAPKSVLVNSSKKYTLSGSGKLTGDMTLTKSGTGSLTISTANTYTGGTILNAGTLVAGNSSAFGTGDIRFIGGELNLGGYTLPNSLTAENADVVIKDGTLQGTFNINGGNLNASKLRIISAVVEIEGAETVSFSDSFTRESGGAIRSLSEILCMRDNGSVTFSGNSSSRSSSLFNLGAGAIDAVVGMNVANNDVVVFRDNFSTSTYALGGAIYVWNGYNVNLMGNGSVVFSGNYASSSATAAGGAIYGNTVIADNESVEFSGNYAIAKGGGDKLRTAGAIYGGLVSIEHNGSVVFSDNYFSSWHGDYAITNCEVYGGGAIYASSVRIVGNKSVLFYNNNSDKGNYFSYYEAAIFSPGNNILIQGNTYVEFRANHAYGGFRGIYLEEGDLLLAAGKDQAIVFYDGILTKWDRLRTVSFNYNFEDESGEEHAGEGEIIFSGKYAEEDLKALKASYTQQEVTNSITSQIYAMTHLYGGRLRIEDGAIYMGYGITAEVDSAATVRLQGGTLSHSGYKLTFNAGTTLEAQGVNRITASSLDLLDGSALTFTLGEANLTTAAVTLTGTFNQGGALTINLADDGTMAIGSKYALLTISSSATPTTWDASKVTVEGLDADISDLSWSNGTLYLTAPLPELTTATWTGAESMVWNTTAKNWTQDGIAYAYKDGVDVIFGDTGAGTVTLAGTLAPKSVLVDSSSDYTWSGDGTLTGDMTLTKSGTGSLTISTANSYTGGTAINGGKVVAMHATALGTGVVTLSDGTLEISANGFANGISASGTSALRVADGYTLALSQMLANSGILTVSGTVNASALTLDTTAATHIDVNGQSGASGFAKSAYYSVQVVNGGTVGGEDAVITHINLPGTETLYLGTDGVAKVGGDIDYSNYLLTGSDTASTAAIHAQGAGATVTQQGGTLTVDDAVTVTTTAGAIDLAGGTLDGIITNATINAASGALNAALTGSNTLNGTEYTLQTAVNNGGTLTMSGSFDASALQLDTTAATHVDVAGNLGDSGFAKDAIYSVTVANGTTVNSGVTITHGTHNLVLGTDGVAKVGGDIDYSNYLLTGSDIASTAAIHAQGAGATVTQQGGTLTVDDAVTVTTTAGTISLAGGTLDGIVTNATINAASGALNAALTGSNTLSGTNYALQSIVSNGGTLTMSGSFDASALHLDTTDATHIDVNGQSGASGFAKDAIYSVAVANGTTVNGGATITHGTHNLVLGTDGVAKAGGDIDYSNYLLTGSDIASTAAIHAQGAGATVTQQGGTLTVD